jgi:hypothetical protein
MMFKKGDVLRVSPKTQNDYHTINRYLDFRFIVASDQDPLSEYVSVIWPDGLIVKNYAWRFIRVSKRKLRRKKGSGIAPLP